MAATTTCHVTMHHSSGGGIGGGGGEVDAGDGVITDHGSNHGRTRRGRRGGGRGKVCRRERAIAIARERLSELSLQLVWSGAARAFPCKFWGLGLSQLHGRGE